MKAAIDPMIAATISPWLIPFFPADCGGLEEEVETDTFDDNIGEVVPVADSWNDVAELVAVAFVVVLAGRAEWLQS